MTYVLGLTGSIGMGKSTTAAMFAADGVPVWDADAAVHRLYAGGAAADPVGAAFPGVVVGGNVSREMLKAALAADPAGFARLEAIVHPLVAADRAAFLAATRADLVLLDIPLLFEGGTDAICDGIAVVSVPADVQRARVLARPGMTTAQFDAILARQMPDADKRARATWVIDTSTPETARAQVRAIIAEIRSHAA
jgi:dephospho-CoA kinase